MEDATQDASQLPAFLLRPIKLPKKDDTAKAGAASKAEADA